MSLLLHHSVLAQQRNTVPAPTISFFTPASVNAGEQLDIFGTNFVNVQTVSLGGVNVGSFTLVNSGLITISSVPNNVQSGIVSVTTASGTANQSGFTFFSFPPPAVITPDQNGNELGFSWTSVVGADSYDWFARPEAGNPSAPIGTAGSPRNTTGLSVPSLQRFTSLSGDSWTLFVRSRKNNGDVSQYRGLFYVSP